MSEQSTPGSRSRSGSPSQSQPPGGDRSPGGPPSAGTERPGPRGPSSRFGRLPSSGRPPSPGREPRDPDPVAATAATWWLTGVSLAVAGAVVAASVALHGGGNPSADGAGIPAAETLVYQPDADRVGELVPHASAARAGLVPVLLEMEEFLPTDGSHPPLDMTDASTVHSWRTGVQSAAAHLGEPPEGTEAHDLAHAGLVSSVELLSMAVQAYSGAALVEDQDLRMDVLHIAMDLRDQAVRSWSVAAAHLDMVSADTGHGRVDLDLPAAGGTAPRPGGGEGDAGDGHDH